MNCSYERVSAAMSERSKQQATSTSVKAGRSVQSNGGGAALTARAVAHPADATTSWRWRRPSSGTMKVPSMRWQRP